jgi:predicted nucleic acid-binding protein
MILVDTSVWVDHLRRRHATLARYLERGEVVCHPFVIGEISLGSLRQRDEVLGLLRELPMASVASHDEVMALVEQRALAGQGIGWVDVHLIASALVDGVRLWTLDRRLAAVARAVDASSE